jgi:hypothetical protein
MKHLKTTERTAALVGIALLLVASTALAQTNGGYDLSWWTADGGGGTLSGSDGPYTLSGTVGQPDAGPALTDSGYKLVGGFWSGVGMPDGPGDHFIYLPLVLKDG